MTGVYRATYKGEDMKKLLMAALAGVLLAGCVDDAVVANKNIIKAADNFELALKNEAKDSAIIYSFLGACYMETGEYEKAVNSYKKALKEEDITAELKQEIQFNLTAVYENMGDWDAAKKQMDKYVKAYPNDERVKKEVEFLETR